MKDENGFKEQVVMLGEVFDKKITGGLIKIYWETLRQYSDEQAANAISAHVRTGTFFPRPADLIKLIDGTSEENAHEAWAEVLRQLTDFANAKFDPATERAVQAMGGAEYLSHMSYHDLEFKKKDFLDYYESTTDRSDNLGIESQQERIEHG